MIKKGLIMCMITFLISALFIECVYYADRLTEEFKETERAETKEIAEISTYDPNGTGGIFLTFRYTHTKDGKEYSSGDVLSYDKELRVGDSVEVVTRDGCPKTLLSNTKRGRQRTALERAADVGYDCGMTAHIIVTLSLLLIIGLPARKTVRKEAARRKRFVMIMTAVYAAMSLLACVLFIVGMHLANSWRGLGDIFLGAIVFVGGAIVLLVGWIINSLRHRNAETAQ